MVRKGVVKVKGNPALARGIRRFGVSAKFRKVGAWIKKNRLIKKPAAAAVKPKEKQFGKDGKRVVGNGHVASRYYPTIKVSRKIPRRFTPKKTKLRKSITPGTVLILLSGRFRGKRVVFVKQLDSGLLLVNGPFKVNGVPIRRVSQAYVIATSTKADLAGVQVNAKLNDAFFTAHKTAKPKETEKTFFSKKQGQKVVPMSAERKALQQELDNSLVAAIKKTPNLSTYLGARFSLTNGQYPHAMKF